MRSATSSTTAIATRSLVVLLVALLGPVALTGQSASLRALVGTTTTGLVTRVLDGDTFDVRLDGRPGTVRVRLFGIDAPERGEPYSNVALRQARTLLFDQRVTLAGQDVDRYGRLVARVTAGGRDVATALLDAGLACHFTRYSNDPGLAQAEANARARGVGFWAAGAPKPRCVAASRPTDGIVPPTPPPGSTTRSTTPRGLVAAGPFHGNTNSHVYHAPHCRNYRCKNCTQVFASEAEAQRAGYRPAGDCLRR